MGQGHLQAELRSDGVGSAGCPLVGRSSGGLLGCPVTQPRTHRQGPGRLGKGCPPRLADGAQRIGEGVQLVLDTLQGAPDGVGTVQHVDGQRVRVKLHGKGALDAGGVAPAEGRPAQTFSHGRGLSGHREEPGPLEARSAASRRAGGLGRVSSITAGSELPGLF